MERSEWLKEKRRLSEVRYDTLHASTYDQNWGQIDASHRSFLHQFLALCPPGCTILDAACGTGKYWPLILQSGRSVVGIDQSQQMLARAHAKFPTQRTEKRGLQEMAFSEEFDGIICVDAMEFIAPEDWPLVLNHFSRALKSHGHLYFTVELLEAKERDDAYHQGLKQGLPVVEGEYAYEGPYHYYPALEQVRRWTTQMPFSILEEDTGDGYHHVLVQRAR